MGWFGGCGVSMWPRISEHVILISVAMIVQNEEKHIARLLESVVGLADEAIHIPSSGDFADMHNRSSNRPDVGR